MTALRAIGGPVGLDDLPEYPIACDARLDSHSFIQWEFRRWMSSDMRWHGTHEAKSIWFELVNLSHSETPVGTLPCDLERLSRMVQPVVAFDHFEALCQQPYGPLHGWVDCRSGEGRRLMHPTVLRVVESAFASKANHTARVEAASRARKLERLTKDIAHLSLEMSEDPRKVRFIEAEVDKRVAERGGQRRTNQDLHFAMQACVDAARAGHFPPRSSA